MNDKLLEYYSDEGPERVGIILWDGSGFDPEVIELRNISENPEQGFLLADKDLLLLDDPDVVGTWHTHPGVTGNLSVNDMEAFLAWPRLSHHIVGNDGVANYVVENGAVIRK